MPTVIQAGVIPRRDGRICLVNSSDGLRWIVPKGHIDAGFTAAGAAAQEAWEEAGLRGTVHPEPVGNYTYSKFGQKYVVELFLMDVSAVEPRWPEMSVRRRLWLAPAEAAELVSIPALGQLILDCSPLVADPVE